MRQLVERMREFDSLGFEPELGGRVLARGLVVGTQLICHERHCRPATVRLLLTDERFGSESQRSRLREIVVGSTSSRDSIRRETRRRATPSKSTGTTRRPGVDGRGAPGGAPEGTCHRREPTQHEIPRATRSSCSGIEVMERTHVYSAPNSPRGFTSSRRTFGPAHRAGQTREGDSWSSTATSRRELWPEHLNDRIPADSLLCDRRPC